MYSSAWIRDSLESGEVRDESEYLVFIVRYEDTPMRLSHPSNKFPITKREALKILELAENFTGGRTSSKQWGLVAESNPPLLPKRSAQTLRSFYKTRFWAYEDENEGL